MGKLLKLIIVIAVLAGIGYAVMINLGKGQGPDRQSASNDKKPRVEEKYGFTTESVGDD